MCLRRLNRIGTEELEDAVCVGRNDMRPSISSGFKPKSNASCSRKRETFQQSVEGYCTLQPDSCLTDFRTSRSEGLDSAPVPVVGVPSACSAQFSSSSIDLQTSALNIQYRRLNDRALGLHFVREVLDCSPLQLSLTRLTRCFYAQRWS